VVRVGVRDDGEIHRPPWIDVKIARLTVETVFRELQQIHSRSSGAHRAKKRDDFTGGNRGNRELMRSGSQAIHPEGSANLRHAVPNL
jgi:hypothetical protein